MPQMTSQAIYNRFQALYGDFSERFFAKAGQGTDSVIWAVEAINDAVDELRSEILHVNPPMLGQLISTIQYVSGTAEYNLTVTGGFDEISLVHVIDLGGPPYLQLLKMDMQQIDQVVPLGPNASWLSGGGRGEPTRYYLRYTEQTSGPPQPVIGFVPTPNRSAASPNVQIYVDPGANQITAIDTTTANTPDLPQDFHTLVAYLIAIYAARVDKPFMVESLEAQYNARLVRRLLSIGQSRDGETELIEIDYG